MKFGYKDPYILIIRTCYMSLAHGEKYSSYKSYAGIPRDPGSPYPSLLWISRDPLESLGLPIFPPYFASIGLPIIHFWTPRAPYHSRHGFPISPLYIIISFQTWDPYQFCVFEQDCQRKFPQRLRAVLWPMPQPNYGGRHWNCVPVLIVMHMPLHISTNSWGVLVLLQSGQLKFLRPKMLPSLRSQPGMRKWLRFNINM